MVIEFTGSTSAGKTIIVMATINILKKNKIPVILGYDYILDHFRISISNKKLKSIAVEMLLLPTVIIRLKKYLSYYKIAIQLILKRKDPVLKTFNKLRNLLKQVAVLEFINTHYSDDYYIILDEGTVHLINNIFVHYKTAPDIDMISFFLPLVPRPDKIIVVDAPTEMIVDRALKRKDAPYNNLTRENWVQMSVNAKTVYSKLADFINNNKQLLLIQNVDKKNDIKNGPESKIADFILGSN